MEEINGSTQTSETSFSFLLTLASVTTVLALVSLAAGGPGPARRSIAIDPNRSIAEQQLGWLFGYELAFVPEKYPKQVILRSYRHPNWHQRQITNLLPRVDLRGVEWAGDLDTRPSLLAVLRGGSVAFHPGQGQVIERHARYSLPAAGVPAIVYVGESRPRWSTGRSCWAVAVRRPDNEVAIRPLLIRAGHPFDGFVNPAVVLPGDAAGDPGAAYHEGELVIAWADKKGGSIVFRTFSATVLHNTNTDGFDLVNRVESELPTDSSKPNSPARPALTHDGVGLFYAAVITASAPAGRPSGLRYDEIHVFSSGDGAHWTPMTASIPDNFHASSLGRVSIAAQPNGEILLALTTVGAGGGGAAKVYKRLPNGSWTTDKPAFVFGVTSDPEATIPFSLTRSRYIPQGLRSDRRVYP